MFTEIGNFLIDQWLWNVTWDWYHIPISIFFMTILFKCFLRINIISSVLIALSSTIASFMAYTLFVVGVLMYVFKFNYNQAVQGQEIIADPLHACLYVAIIYTVLQAIFFIALNHYYPVPRLKMILVAAVANALTAGTIYLVLPNPLM